MTTRDFDPVERAVAMLHADDSLAVPLGPGVPGGFLHALAARDDFTNLRVFGALLPDLYEIFTRPAVHYQSGFFGPAERFLRDSGADIDFVPADFRRFAPVLERKRPRVIATAASMPEEGSVSLSLHAGATTAEIAAVIADPQRVLIVECSPHFPRTHGVDRVHSHRIDLADIDVLIESDRRPLDLADIVPTAEEVTIANHAMSFISDGCTLQTGIGGIPSQIATLLAQGGGGDYGVHSEMFTTGLMHLHQAGKVTNRKGSDFDGFSLTTFAAGTPALYEWLDDNRDVRFAPVHVVNSPDVIARNRKMISINGAMAVDLSGQVVADTILGKQFSGIGGHEDFVSGPGLVTSGRSLLCLPSTTVVDGRRVSRITGRLPEGSVITTPRHQVDVVITEYGIAEVEGMSIVERSHALAAISHPDFRDELLAVAKVWPVD